MLYGGLRQSFPWYDTGVGETCLDGRRKYRCASTVMLTRPPSPPPPLLNVVRAQGERNFHILYELVAGAKRSNLAKQLEVRMSTSGLSTMGIVCVAGVLHYTALYCTVLYCTVELAWHSFRGEGEGCGGIGVCEGGPLVSWQGVG